MEVYGTQVTIVPVTSVALNAATATVNTGATTQLTATVAPSNATNKNVTWASSNTAIATVSSTGLVTAKAIGTATITVTTQDGAKIATCVVTVSNPTTNIALNKPVTATTTQAGLLTASVNDGNATTRWGSEWVDPQTVTIDLQASYTITKVVLNWEAACAKSYTVDVSADNVTWTNIYTTTTGAAGINTITPSVSATGRYIRMKGTVRAIGWGYSLYEFEVYGAAKSATEKTSVAQNNSNGFMVYPNPVVNQLNIELGENNNYTQIELYDLTGKVIDRWTIEVGETSVSKNVSNLKSCMYLVRINGKQSGESFRIVKK
jgi:hypothetical protein